MANARYYRLEILNADVRDSSSANLTQFSEFTLYDGATEVTIDSTSGSAGHANLIDGNTGTKAERSFEGSTTGIGISYTFDVGAGLPDVDSYTFTTANDADARDPVTWYLWGSADNSTWVLLDYEVDQDAVVPTARQTETAKYTIDSDLVTGEIDETTSGTDAHPFKHFVFPKARLRDNTQDLIQVTEIVFFSGGVRVYPIAVTQSAGQSNLPAGFEGSELTYDDDPTTKWLDNYSSGSRTQNELVFEFSTSPVVDRYRFITGNDADGRDPIGWIVGGSTDGALGGGSVTYEDVAANTANSTTQRRLATPDFDMTPAGGGGATDYTLACDAGSFSITGQDANLVYTAGATNYTLTCDAGSYSISGQDADLNYSAGATAYTLDCEAGSFTIAGQDADLNYAEGAENFTLDCEAGAFTITGQDATLNIGSLSTSYTLTCEAGAFVIDGQDADLTYTEGAENFTLECEAGNFVINGQDAEFNYVSNAPVNYTLICEAGSFNIDGQDASFLLNGVDQSAGSHGFDMGGSSFRDGRRVPLPFKTTETRKSKRLRRKLEKVEKERAKVKKLIADTSKSKTKDKATQAAIDKSRVYEALLTQQANDLNERLMALVGSFEQQAQDELLAYQIRKQQEEAKAAQEQFILEDIARKQAAEADDMIFIMAMLAAA